MTWLNLKILNHLNLLLTFKVAFLISTFPSLSDSIQQVNDWLVSDCQLINLIEMENSKSKIKLMLLLSRNLFPSLILKNQGSIHFKHACFVWVVYFCGKVMLTEMENNKSKIKLILLSSRNLFLSITNSKESRKYPL